MASTQTLLVTPAAGADNSANPLDTDNYVYVIFHCALTSTDTVTVKIMNADGTLVPAPDNTGSVAGLSANNPSRVYFGGPGYVLGKVGNASSPSIFYTPVGKGAAV